MRRSDFVKKILKNFLSVILIPAVLMSVGAVKIWAETNGKDNLHWSLSDKGVLTVSGKGRMDNYGYTEPPWSPVKDSIRAVTVSAGVENIGENAFSYCYSLEKVTAESGLTEIGAKAFCSCNLLREVNLPDSVTEIGEGAFKDCTALINFDVPRGMSEISKQSFYGCISLESVTVPDTVILISRQAFFGCESLKNLKIPDSVTSIGMWAFVGCVGLKSVIIPGSIEAVEDSVFSACTGLESVVISDGVKSIEQSAFSGCTSLEVVYLPKTVTDIKGYAFSGCTALTDIFYSGSQSDREKMNIADYSETGDILKANWCFNRSQLIAGNVSGKGEYPFLSTVTFHSDVPAGCSIRWYLDGVLSGEDGSFTVSKAKKDYTVKAVITDGNGNEQTDEEKVSIKSGIFDILFSLLKLIFNRKSLVFGQK